MEPAKVSFTVRRPTPVSRAASSGPDSDAGSSFKVPTLPRHLVDESTPLGSPLARSSASSPRPKTSQTYHDYHEPDSSDEDDVIQDELVSGFDKFGVQRCVYLPDYRLQLFQLTEASLDDNRLNGERKKVDKLLVIPALKNKDWREQARKRKALQYVPPSAAATTGADGSVGGLGTKDTINSGPILSGLQIHRKETVAMEEVTETRDEQGDIQMSTSEELSEDQRALQALLAEAGGEMQHDGPVIDIIPSTISETDALKQDVEELPDEATLDDYARVPVAQFGAALLRGMGWKEGTAASRKPGKGLVEPYLPTARPALLGIGAKEQEVLDDGSKNKKKYVDKRYVPIMKQERTPSSTSSSRDRRDRSRSPRRDSSRRNSPDRYGSRKDRDEDSDQKKRRHDDDSRRDRDRERDRSKYHDSERRTGERDRRYDGDGDRRKDREGGTERDRDRDRSYSNRKRDRSRESSRRKDY
ncbi:DExH-box splicing factor binding site-domain-containing protein [Panaeolus papilionaceus]|nr:DExH-box splicing factor binding site-domain-containing protein [Panaeolus papilionaceus]